MFYGGLDVRISFSVGAIEQHLPYLHSCLTTPHIPQRDPYHLSIIPSKYLDHGMTDDTAYA